MNFQVPDIDTVASTIAELRQHRLAPVVSIAAAAGLAVYALTTAIRSNNKTPKVYKEIPVAEGRLPYFGNKNV